jgi:predicted deacylase
MQWTTQSIDVKQLATGEVLKLQTHTLTGNHPGPHIHIQASVHGAELQGNAVILKLMEELKRYDVHGSITFVPLCNPYATNQKVGTYTYGRFNPVTGDNWNRNFFDIIEKTGFDVTHFAKSHFDSPWDEVKRAWKHQLSDLYQDYENTLKEQGRFSDNITTNMILQKLACKADGILDMHTGPTATRYLYSGEYEVEAAKKMLFKHILVIPNEFGGAMDEANFMPWIHLQRAYKKLGRDIDLDVESFTLEFGSEETFCMEWAKKDVTSVLNYLAFKGVIQEETQTLEKLFLCQLKNYKTLYAERGGLVDYKVHPGDHFKKGDLLARYYSLKELDPANPLTSCEYDLKAKEDGIVINLCPSSAVHQGMELFQIMTDITEE